MSYSISFLPPPQSRHSPVPKPHEAAQSISMPSSSCHESRAYLEKLNEQQQALVRPLLARVEHWKGHCLCSFGKPLLQAKVMVSRAQPGGETSMNEVSTRQYQAFLFSNILICCRKRSRPNAQGRDWTLKGRVFLRNVYDVQQIEGEFRKNNQRDSPNFSKAKCSAYYTETKLHISYLGDDGADNFTIDFAKPSLMGRWAAVLDHFRARAAEPRALEEASSSHSDIPPPAYYSPLPEYTSVSASILSAPPMERHSPLNTPLSTPPLYTPSDLPPSSLDSSVSSSQYTCRPAMTTSLSASTIGSVRDHYVGEEPEEAPHSLDKLEETKPLAMQPIRLASALVSAMASGQVIYRSLALVSVCLYLAYLGVSHQIALVPDEGRLEVR